MELLLSDPEVEDDNVDSETIPEVDVPLSVFPAETIEVIPKEELELVSDVAPVAIPTAVPEVEVPLFIPPNDPKPLAVLAPHELETVSFAGIKTWLGNPNVELDAKLAANTPLTNHQGFATSVVRTGVKLVSVCGLL